MKAENKAILAAAAILTALLALLLLSGCNTTKKAIETIVAHDTAYIVHTDTIREAHVINHTDTLIRETERIITLRDSGDTLKIVETHDNYRYVYVSDSANHFRSVADSLLRILDKQHNKEIVKQRTKYPWRWLIVGVALFLCCLAVLKSRTK